MSIPSNPKRLYSLTHEVEKEKSEAQELQNHKNEVVKEKSEAQELQNHKNEVVKEKSEAQELQNHKNEVEKEKSEAQELQNHKNEVEKEKSEAQELQNHKNEVEELKAELEKKDKELATFSAQNSKLSSSIENLSKESLEIRNVSITLEAAVTDLKTRNEMSETICQQYKTQVHQITLEAERATKQNEILTKQNETLLAKCEQLNVSLMEKEDSEAQQLINHHHHQKLNTELERKEKGVAEILGNYRQKVAYLDRRVVGLETANAILEARKEFPMKQNQILQAKCDQLNSSLKEKEESVAHQLQKHQNEVQKLNVELEKRNKELENCSKRVVDSNRKLVTFERVKVSLETRREFLVKQNQILWAKCEQLNLCLKRKGESEARQLQNHQNEVLKLNVKLEQKDKALENCTQKVVDSNRKVIELETRKEFLMIESQILLTKYLQLNSSLKEKDESEAHQLQKHQNIVKKLDVTLEKRDKKLENYAQKVADSNNRVLALERVKASLESEVESLKKRTSKQQLVSTKKKKSVVNEETGPARPKRTRKDKDDPAFIYTLQQKTAKILQKDVPQLYITRKKLLPKVVENNKKKPAHAKVTRKSRGRKRKSMTPAPTLEEPERVAEYQKSVVVQKVKSKQKRKPAVAKFLSFYKKTKKVDLLTLTSNTDLPFGIALANSSIASAQISPQQSITGAQCYPPLHLDDIKREDIFGDEVSNFDQNPHLLQSTNLDDVACQIKEESS